MYVSQMIMRELYSCNDGKVPFKADLARETSNKEKTAKGSNSGQK